MVGAAMLATTLPTVVGMGVIAQTTQTMFAKDRRAVARGKRPRRIVIVGVAQKKANADKFAVKYRKALQRKGLPYTGRVKVKRVAGGYAITYRRG